MLLRVQAPGVEVSGDCRRLKLAKGLCRPRSIDLRGTPRRKGLERPLLDTALSGSVSIVAFCAFLETNSKSSASSEDVIFRQFFLGVCLVFPNIIKLSKLIVFEQVILKNSIKKY